MADTRYLIVNADDFGLSPGVNQGIIHAHEHGIVTSASLMVRAAAAQETVAFSHDHPRLSLGLHVDLGEWCFRDGEWVTLYEVVPSGDRVSVESEVAAQLRTFRELTGTSPTHLDSHQHIHRSEPVCSVLREMALELGIPLRHYTPEILFCGDFYGQTGEGEPWPAGISVDALLDILAALPPGVTELGCHPGIAADLDSVYRDERAAEVAVLCDRRVKSALADGNIRLCSFAELRTLI